MDFGQPTVLAVPADGDCAIITPSMKLEMAGNMSWIGMYRQISSLNCLSY